MVELYDVLLSALNGHFPSDATKYDTKYSNQSLFNIYKVLSEHEGEMALLIKVDGRKVLPPKLVQICSVGKREVRLKYAIYNSRGEFRQYMTEGAGYVNIFCRQVQIKLFGNI